ncbi:hypothetical protein EEB19_10085 [Gordonia sp. OPL2]|nr:hypothetical protein EEB19_10085 [Gordonia sp. OPL2]
MIDDPTRAEQGPGYFTVDFTEVRTKGGKFSATVTDNRKSNARAFVDSFNAGEPSERHQTLTNMVQVVVSFTPKEGQSAHVVRAVGGAKGAGLQSSPQAEEIGGLTSNPYWTLRADRDLPLVIS